MAQDGDHIYFTAVGVTSGTGKVARVSKAGGVVEDLVTNQLDPRGIAVDSSGVYWVNEGDGAVRARRR